MCSASISKCDYSYTVLITKDALFLNIRRKAAEVFSLIIKNLKTKDRWNLPIFPKHGYSQLRLEIVLLLLGVSQISMAMDPAQSVTRLHRCCPQEDFLIGPSIHAIENTTFPI